MKYRKSRCIESKSKDKQRETSNRKVRKKERMNEKEVNGAVNDGRIVKER